MALKKQCKCGFIASAVSIKAAIAAIKAHCEHTGCEVMDARNV